LSKACFEECDLAALTSYRMMLIYFHVGWVERKRNPPFRPVWWVSLRSTHPTNMILHHIAVTA